MSCGRLDAEKFVALVNYYIGVNIANQCNDVDNVIPKLEKIIEKECVSEKDKDKVGCENVLPEFSNVLTRTEILPPYNHAVTLTLFDIHVQYKESVFSK